MPPQGHPQSWYAATANPHAGHPPLTADTDCDVAIIGGGYAGLSAALCLAERGYSVVLVEAGRVGCGASGRNGGQIITGYNRSMAEIAARTSEADARLLWQMSLEANALIARRVAGYGIACDLSWGFLLAAIKPRHVVDLYEHIDEWQGTYGYDQASIVEGADVQDWVRCPRYRAVMVDRGSGHLHPLNYALGLADAAVKAGARIFEETPATSLALGPRTVVAAPSGEVRARFVVLAGNAYLAPIASQVARSMHPFVMPVGTWVVATVPLGEDGIDALIPSRAAVSDMNFVLNYYRPTSDHRLLFGGGVDYTGRAPTDVAASLRRTIAAYYPTLASVPIDYAWSGNVAITRNRLPAFGRLADNAFYVQGFSGHGVALAGLAGQLMAEAVAGTAERFDVFTRIPHKPFPGGRLLRVPALVLAMAWYRLRDLLTPPTGEAIRVRDALLASPSRRTVESGSGRQELALGHRHH